MISMLGWRAPACWRADRAKGKKRDRRESGGNSCDRWRDAPVDRLEGRKGDHSDHGVIKMIMKVIKTITWPDPVL
jgi:hypothetical protein